MDPPPSGLVRAVKVVLKSLASLPEASAPTSCLRYVLDQFEGAASHGPTARALDRAAAREPPPETDGAAPDVAARPVAGGVAHGDAALLATVDAAGLGEVRDAVAALEARSTHLRAVRAVRVAANGARRYRDGEARGAVTGEFGGDAEHALATLNPRGGALGAAEALHRCAAGRRARPRPRRWRARRLRAIAISVDVLVAGPDLEVAMEAFAHVVLSEALAAERSAESLVVGAPRRRRRRRARADALAAFGAATGALHRAWDDGSPRVAAAAAAEQAATAAAAARWRWRGDWPWRRAGAVRAARARAPCLGGVFFDPSDAARVFRGVERGPEPSAAAEADGAPRHPAAASAGDVVVAVDGAAVPDAETCASLLDGKASAALTLRRVVDDGDGDDDAAR
ncbi:hypothetical protein SO694_000721102 [Aureococcus anophagefferens]|uniref:PDZ domain-containing protein n=1 Tax=Aureococcus anophagefferens TaxID=44056 RepID=A0ABR1FIM4_AURAN